LIRAAARGAARVTLPIVGARRGVVVWMALARPLMTGQFLFIAFAFGCLPARSSPTTSPC
jgi:cytochrome c-type biogenesis protein CcmF